MQSVVFLCLMSVALAQAKPQQTVVSKEKVENVKEINIFLNLPSACSSVYDGIIKQLENCRSGTERGDVRLNELDRGCLIKLDLSQYRIECERSNVVLFPDNAPVEFPFNF